MTEAAEQIQETLQQTAVLRLRFHGAWLAALTGLGLFFVGAARDPISWLIYIVASFGWIMALERWVRSEERRVVEPRASAPNMASVRRGEDLDDSYDLASSSGPARAGSELEQLDYLGAFRHELRTPLNAVLGFSDVLLSGIDGELNASQKEDLEIIRASGIRLRVLLDSALDISQLAEGPIRLDTDRIDLRELVARAAIEATQLWASKREARCVLPDRPCILEVDETRLRRSVLVLADFLSTHHRDASISLSLHHSTDQLGIEISASSADRPSIEALPTTAEVLAAEDMSKIRQWPVAVTSELVTLHGGSLYHGSNPSRFLIRLPIGGTP